MQDSKRKIISLVKNAVGGILVIALFVGGSIALWPSHHSGMQWGRKLSTGSPVAGNTDFTVDGVLDTDTVDISSKLPGRLAAVFVEEGDMVHAGQVVAVLQADELAAKQEQATAGLHGAEEQMQQGQIAVGLENSKAQDQIQQAQAGVQAATASLNMAKSKLAALVSGARPQEIEQAEQAVAAAQAAYDTAKKTNDRIQALADEGVVAQQKADEATMAYRSATAQLTAAKAKLSLVRSGARQEEIDAAREQVRQAEAGVDAAKGALKLAEDGRAMVSIRQKDVDAARQKVAAGKGAVDEVAAYQNQTRIISPINGQVSQRMARGGEIIAPGYAILSVARTDRYWVDVYVDESKFAGHHVGEEVQVEIPAVGKTVTGTISKLLPAADFATKRATNEKGSFDMRSVQLRVTLAKNVEELASGLTARVHFAATGGR